MIDERSSVFLDEAVALHIVRIVSEAQKQVIMVTPYLKLWRHIQNEIEKAIKRNVSVRFLVRDQADIVSGEDVAWLCSHGVKVQAVEGLHAKVYLNENTVVLSSMNVTEASTTRSLEVGFTIRDKVDEQKIRDYVLKSLLEVSRPLNLKPQAQATVWAQSPPAQPSQLRHTNAVCIRCHQPIPFNPDRPLCPACYGKWADYSNPDYEEKFCHMCGRDAETSYAKPLCRSCWQKANYAA